MLLLLREFYSDLITWIELRLAMLLFELSPLRPDFDFLSVLLSYSVIFRNIRALNGSSCVGKGEAVSEASPIV